MSLDNFTDASLVSIAGAVSITKDVVNGTAGNLTVAGTLTNTGAVTAATGISVTAGGITVTAGGVSVTAGGATVTGGITTDQLGGGMSGTAVAIASAGTVATNVRHSRVSPAGAVTSCVLGSGTFNGQTVIVDNRSTTAANAVSFAITSGASNILNAAATVIVSGMTTKQFVWDGSFWNT